MTRWFQNVFRLGLKEISSLARDVVLVLLIIYSFTIAIYVVATGRKTEVRSASVAIVDADQSTLSARIKESLQPPYFQNPKEIDRSEVDILMDRGQYTFILEIPPRFEADVLAGRGGSIQANVDATAMTQAGVGTAYIQQIIVRETSAFLKQRGSNQNLPIDPVYRALFNQNLEAIRFNTIMEIIKNVTILTVILVGAAIIREREHGTIEHLLVMPVGPSEIAAAKIWANGAVVLLAATFSLYVVAQILLQIPVSGSIGLFLAGAVVYIFSVAALGILLATVVNSMPQFGLLAIPVFVIMILLSGSMTPFESMPVVLQKIMHVAPSTHFVKFAQSVLYRGAGIGVVWRDLVIMLGLGAFFLVGALLRFRLMLAQQS
jgi:ABC-2 type transport system permease protein